MRIISLWYLSRPSPACSPGSHFLTFPLSSNPDFHALSPAAPAPQDASSRKRGNAESAEQPSKRRKTGEDVGSEAAEPAPMSTKKATKKLKKKLGRSPTEAEIAAFIAKKLRKSAKSTSQPATDSPYTRAGGASAVAAVAAGESEAAKWVDSVGEPPHKAMVRENLATTPCPCPCPPLPLPLPLSL